jgi:hypothetical protein
VKTSDKHGPIALGILKVVQGGVGMLGFVPDVTGLVPVGAGLGGRVTNTSDTLLPSSSAIGLDGGVWKDSKLFICWLVSIYDFSTPQNRLWGCSY